MRGGIAGCATFLVTGYRKRPVQKISNKAETKQLSKLCFLRKMREINFESGPNIKLSK